MMAVILPILILTFFAGVTPFLSRILRSLRLRNAESIWATLGFALALLSVFRVMGPVAEQGIVIFTPYPNAEPPIAGFLAVDWLGLFASIVFIVVGLLASIHSIDYMSHDTGLDSYYTLLLLMVAGMVGLAYAGDFMTFYIFWELMSIASYCLVGFRKHLWEPIEAGFKYLVMSAAGTSMVLFSMSLLYGLTGSLSFAHIAFSLLKSTPSPVLFLAVALLVAGFGVKAAAVPFHFWLPDAHPAAPSPISAMLSGVVIKTGIYGLVRTLYLFFAPNIVDFSSMLAVLSVLTMTVGNVMALLQKDIKRLLAYSSISHIGYILLAMSLGTEYGLTGALLHVFNHAIMKGLAFLCAGAFIHVTGTRNIDELIGVGRKMPITAMTFAIALLSLCGVPFLNGFVSKYVIFAAAIEAKAYLLTVIGLLNSGLSVVYYLRLIQLLMLREPKGKAAAASEASISILVPLVIMAFICILFGIWPEPIYKMAEAASAAAMAKMKYIILIFAKPA
ncbi:MAG: cation:proton antiporter [archaeon GB-1867-005]|nr:cation:proton antiporter [Candidatus Culexmicrobium cathedralense]